MVDPLTTFGPYRVMKTLARGGMAEIFMAKKEGPAGFSKTVVVKRILPQHAANEEFVQMFRDEARLAAQLEHPNIVHITDFGEVQGSYFLAMEYLQGQELGALLKGRLTSGQGPFPPAVAATIAAQACAGLHYAHTFADETGRPLRIVHRDISPSNLFVTFQGAVKVLDFGIAKAEGKLTQTRAGMVKGKLLYMSPEQTWAKVLDARSDVWAIGVVLYELLTGNRAFFRSSEADPRSMNERMTMMAIDQESPPRLREFAPAIPAALDDIVFKCLEKDPNRRWQTAAELRRALDGFLQTQQVSSSLLAEFLEQTVGVEQIRALTQPTPAHQAAQSEAPSGSRSVEHSLIEPLSVEFETRQAPLTPDPERQLATLQRPIAPPEPTRETPTRATSTHTRPVLPKVIVAVLAMGGVTAMWIMAEPSSPAPEPRPVPPPRPPIEKRVPIPAPVAAAIGDSGVLEAIPAVPDPPAAVDAGASPRVAVGIRTERDREKSTPPPRSTTLPPTVVAEQPKPSGWLKLSCPPYGAVTVDGKEVGTASPTLVLELVAGAHEVSCRHPDLGGPKAAVTITGGTTLEKRLDY